MTDWATLTEANDIAPAGLTVTAQNLAVAQSIVELFSGTTTAASDAGSISSRNLRLLGLATRYQAVFVANHPDLLTNMDVDSFGQDGLNVTYANSDAQLLAPLASRCINRLSWKQRGLRTARRGSRRFSERGNRNSAARDDDRGWTPL